MEIEKEENIEQIIERDFQIEEANTQNQKSFLQTTIGKVVNTGLDIGLRMILPDFIEDQIIQIKDVMLGQGFKEGIDSAIDSAIDLGKTVMGIFTGKFDSITQAQTAVKKGGILDGVSSIIDNVLKSSTKSGLLNTKTSKLIKKGKNAILSCVESNIEGEFLNQIKEIEKVGKYMNNWRQYYEKQDFDGMEKEYQKIKKQLTEIMPLDNTIKQAKKIENIHELIKNKNSFELSEEEKNLAQKLV